MALLDKFRRKREKEEDFVKLGDDLDLDDRGDYGPAGEEKKKSLEQDMSLPTMPLVPPMAPPEPESFAKRDFEVVNLKLSTLASEIEALKHRIAALEGKLNPQRDVPPVPLQGGFGTTAPKDTEWHY